MTFIHKISVFNVQITSSFILHSNALPPQTFQTQKSRPKWAKVSQSGQITERMGKLALCKRVAHCQTIEDRNFSESKDLAMT